MLLLRPPTVYRAQGDTWLLAAALEAESPGPGTRCLDLCSGSGALALAAARRGASVTAIDVSWRAVVATRINCGLRGLPVSARRGDLFEPVAGERFDLVVSNPPYVVAASDRLPRWGPARSWDAGTEGRAVIERICERAPAHLSPGGVILLVFSRLCDEELVAGLLERSGLATEVAARALEPFGPVMTGRARWLEERGLITAGQRHEELVVVRGQAAG